MSTPDTEKAVEAAAVAIYSAEYDIETYPLEVEPPDTKKLLRIQARAALEASGYPARIEELQKEVERLRTIVDEQQDEIDDQDSDLDEIIDERKSLYAQLTAAEQRVEKLTEALDYIARLSLCDWSATTARAALSNSENE